MGIIVAITMSSTMSQSYRDRICNEEEAEMGIVRIAEEAMMRIGHIIAIQLVGLLPPETKALQQ